MARSTPTSFCLSVQPSNRKLYRTKPGRDDKKRPDRTSEPSGLSYPRSLSRMLAEIGYGILVVAFVVALYSVGAAVYGERRKSAAVVESARRAMLLLWPLITLAAASLIV